MRIELQTATGQRAELLKQNIHDATVTYIK